MERRRSTDQGPAKSLLKREAFLVGLAFVALGILSVGTLANVQLNSSMKQQFTQVQEEFDAHRLRSDAQDLCLLDSAGTPVPPGTPNPLDYRRTIYKDCVARESGGVPSPVEELREGKQQNGQRNPLIGRHRNR